MGANPASRATPIGTPRSAGYNYPRQKSKGPDHFFHWQTRHHQVGDDDLFNHDDVLFLSDDEDSTLPLFLSSSPQPPAVKMPGPASPINIATARQSSSSPRNQQSNLTSQLQQPRIDVRDDTSADQVEDLDVMGKGRQESVGMLGTTPFGAQSIPQRGQRRESNSKGLSGSMMTGMSWGGLSMSNFIEDDFMTGTSPYNLRIAIATFLHRTFRKWRQHI